MLVLFVTIAMFLLLTAAIVWRPATAMCAMVCGYSFEQWALANSPLIARHPQSINFAVGILTLLAVLISVLQGNKILGAVRATSCLWFVLFIMAGISCFWSISSDLSRFLFGYHLPYVVTFVVLFPLVINDPDDLRIGMNSVLIGGTVVLLLLLFETNIHAWGRTITLEHHQAFVNRVGQRETRLSPLAVADMAGVVLIFITLMNFQGLSRLWQLLRWGVVLLALGIIYRSGSRGQLIAAIAAVLLCLGLSRGFRRWIGIATGLASLVILGVILTWSFSAFAQAERWRISKMESEFRSTRVQMCEEILDYWQSSAPYHWFIGLGSSAAFDLRVIGIYPHVVPVEVLCELGLLGFSILTLLWLLTVRDLWRLYRSSRDVSVDRGIVAALAGWFVFQSLLCLKQSSFLGHTTTFACILVISRYAYLYLAAQRKREWEARWYLWWRARLSMAVPGA